MKQINRSNWNETKAAHLLGRAGFGATPEQIAATAADDPARIIDDLLRPVENVVPPDWVTPESVNKPDKRKFRGLTEEERREKRRAQQQEYNRQITQLRRWWLDRMLHTSNPLQEKMTLFWHGHFATSIQKVRVPYMMYAQNQTFRRHALGNWQELITAVSQDPAMLIYLDNAKSRANAPNENYARELMELFTLGEGHYTENDIKEAARAFTGWTIAPKSYTFADLSYRRENYQVANKKRWKHDSGSKTFFGQSGHWTGHHIIRIILEQEQAARFITEKLWRFFAYEDPEPEIIEALAADFRMNNYELAPVLRNMFMSEAFYSAKAMRTQIKSPVQWLIGSLIVMDAEVPDGRTCQNILRSLGQVLFAPPNVKGWDGGFAWITTATLTSRYNLSGNLLNRRSKATRDAQGRKIPGRPFVQTDTILPPDTRRATETAYRYLKKRIYQAELPAADDEKLRDYLAALPNPNQWRDDDIRKIVHLMMSTPQYQLT